MDRDREGQDFEGEGQVVLPRGRDQPPPEMPAPCSPIPRIHPRRRMGEGPPPPLSPRFGPISVSKRLRCMFGKLILF